MRTAIADASIERGEAPVWLLTLRLPDGASVRVASEAVSIPVRALGADGPYQYAPLLAGLDDFDEELDLFSLDGSGALTQATVDITTTRDLAAGQGDWLHVTAATVEIATIWPGQSWEDRTVLLDGGTVQGIEWGWVGEVTSISVETTPPVTSANVGDDDRDVGADFPAPVDTGAGVLTELEGSKYQWVYGAPESIPAYKVGEVSAGFDRLILAGHDFARTGASYQVTVYEDGAAGVAYTVGNATTSGGEPYAYVEAAAASPAFKVGNGAYTYKATHGGIVAADDAGSSAMYADGVLRRLLVDSGLRVDWARMAPTLAMLRGWRVGFYADAEASAIDLIRDRLVPYLPLVEMAGGDGLYFLYADPLVGDIEAELIVGQNLLGRVGRMSMSDPEAIRNGFTIRYGFEAFTGEYLSTVTLGAANSALCYLSQQLYGVREDDVLECDVTWDVATATRMLTARASRIALPRRIGTYEAAPDLYWLRAGAVVTLTDATYGITRQRAIVASVARAMTPFQVRLEMVDRTPMSAL